MNKKDIVIGFVILLIAAGVIFWFRREKPQTQIEIPEATSTEQKIEEKFNVQIPEDVDRAELKDVAGGDSSGIATRKYEDGAFELTVLADLPEPEGGVFYEAWLEGEEIVSLGKLSLVKGGYVLNYTSKNDYSGYNKVSITKEKFFDSNPETVIIEGEF